MATEEGKVVFRHEDMPSTDTIRASAGTTGGFGYVVKVPLAEIPPGSYVLSVEARSTLDVEKEKAVRHQTLFSVVAR